MLETFLERLKALRKKNKLTQPQIADRLEISLSAYRRYESGQREPGIWDVVKMANLFGVSVDYLVGRTDEP